MPAIIKSCWRSQECIQRKKETQTQVFIVTYCNCSIGVPRGSCAKTENCHSVYSCISSLMITETAKALVFKNRVVYKNITPFLISAEQLKAQTPKRQIQSLYRRFIRLSRFLTTTQTLQNSYKEYLKEKFVLGVYDPTKSLRSLYFVASAVSSDNEQRQRKRLLVNIIQYQESLYHRGISRNLGNTVFMGYLKIYNTLNSIDL